jgi:hypothetical protein
MPTIQVPVQLTVCSISSSFGMASAPGGEAQSAWWTDSSPSHHTWPGLLRPSAAVCRAGLTDGTRGA